MNNNEWHSVDLRRRKNNVTLILDGEVSTKAFGGEFGRLDLDSQLNVAGVGHNEDLQPYGLMKKNYAGCLENFLFDDVDILYSVKYNKPLFDSHGDLYYGCPETFYVPISFAYPASMALLPTHIPSSLSVSLKFRTHLDDGMILAKVSLYGNVYLGVKNGKVFLQVVVPVQSPIILTAGEDVSDGTWHNVEININKASVSLKLDDEQPKMHTNSWLEGLRFSIGNATLGGGAEQIISGFVGCIYDIWVDGTSIDYRTLGNSYMIGGIIGTCTITDRCLLSPCKNGGTCKQDWAKFTCDCTMTMYSGVTCEDSIYQTSCQDYQDFGLVEDSYCVIDPDGPGKIKPLRVMCNVTRPDKAITVIQASTNARREVKTGTLLGGKYTHPVSYGIDSEALDYMMQSAVECKQFVRYSCKSALLMNSPRGPTYAEWFSRSGDMEEYWGGATRGSGKCACGENRTCSDPIKYCNCDKGDDVWREDSG